MIDNWCSSFVSWINDDTAGILDDDDDDVVVVDDDDDVDNIETLNNESKLDDRRSFIVL